MKLKEFESPRNKVLLKQKPNEREVISNDKADTKRLWCHLVKVLVRGKMKYKTDKAFRCIFGKVSGSGIGKEK